jgi:hypothetical protein
VVDQRKMMNSVMKLMRKKRKAEEAAKVLHDRR